jgi:hypothetical protein
MSSPLNFTPAHQINPARLGEGQLPFAILVHISYSLTAKLMMAEDPRAWTVAELTDASIFTEDAFF